MRIVCVGLFLTLSRLQEADGFKPDLGIFALHNDEMSSLSEDLLASAPIGDQCRSETLIWLRGLHNFSTNAMQCISGNCSASNVASLKKNLFAARQLDSFGRFPAPGLLDLNTYGEGSYQECKEVDGVHYRTNYCYMQLQIGKHPKCVLTNAIISAIKKAVCMPASCNETDLTVLYNLVEPRLYSACTAVCPILDVPKDAAFWIYTSFMIAMGSIVVVASLVDYIRTANYELPSSNCTNIFLRLLLAFSMYTNAELLLSVKMPKAGHIRSLDCIRFISMSWVVSGHLLSNFLVSDALIPLLGINNELANMMFINGFLAVDTFFVLSGIVVAYLFFKAAPTRKMVTSPLTWILFYVHRYLRLTPPYMLFIGFWVVYAPFLQGPWLAANYNTVPLQVASCKTDWWKNLLYFNNFDDAKCYPISWYLAADTQLYLVVPIALTTLFFSFTAGVLLLLASGIASVVATYIIFYHYHLPPTPFSTAPPEVMSNFYEKIYYVPWIRCTPYIIGIFTGYVLAKFGSRNFKVNPAIVVVMWMTAGAVGAACVFGIYDYSNNFDWSEFTDATYYSFHRIGWGLAVAWVIAANHIGWGGPIADFMCHPIWQPFGRLSYCAYIVHWMVVYYYLNLLDRQIHYVSIWQAYIYYVVPITLLAYVAAFFWSCLFEVPTLKLEKMLLEGLLGSGVKASSKVAEVHVEKPVQPATPAAQNDVIPREEQEESSRNGPPVESWAV